MKVERVERKSSKSVTAMSNRSAADGRLTPPVRLSHVGEKRENEKT